MRPSERLTAGSLLLLSAAVALLRPAGTGPRLLVLAALLLVTGLLSRPGGRSPGRALARDYFPVLVVVVVFSLLQAVVEAANPRRYDALFAALDDRWLAPLARAWRGALGRPAAFTDAVYLVYVSYYFLPIAVASAARRRGAAEFERAVFPVLLAFYLSFAGYFLWPTAGPRLPAAEEAALGGGAVSAAVRAFLRWGEATTLDAFPSGHTAVALVAAAAGGRLFPRAAPALWAWAGAIVFSTVYIRVHYAVDVLAGLALGGAVLLARRNPRQIPLALPRQGG